MPIRRYIRTGACFDDEATRLMGEAFEAACAEAGDVPDIVREIIALRIIDAAQKGHRDPVRLRQAGIVSLDA